MPSTVLSNCRIRIRDNINSCKQDISDQFFTISTTPSAITLTNPNGGDTLTGCNNYTFNWTETSSFGNYDFAYSTNSGSTWNDIVLNHPTTSLSYEWLVPKINSSTVLVRVKPTGDPSFDLSDALFTIENNVVQTTLSDTICENETYTLPNRLIVNTAGIYIDTLNANNTCDSIITVNLSVNSTNNTTVYSTSCNEGDTGIVVSNLLNIFGCDSIFITITSLLPSYDTIINLTSCNPTDTGVVIQSLTNQYTCDSIITTITSLLDSDNDTVNLASCNPVDVGTVVSNLTNQNGCDSIVTTITTLLASDAVTVNLTSCDPANVGTVVSNLTNQNDCDSIVTTITTHLASDADTVNLTSCDPTDLGTVVSNLTNLNGCDSIVTTITTLLPSFATTGSVNICSGDNYTFADGFTENNITSDMSYTSNLITNNNCDSIIETSLVVTALNSNVSQSENILNSDMNGATYQWINCIDNQDVNGATNQSFSPIENGKYAVKISHNGCSETSECIDVVSIGIGNNLDNVLIIYPNPVKNSIFIKYDKIIESKIINILGAEVSSSFEKTLDVKKLSSGIYFLHIYNTNKELISINKFVKE